MKLLCRLSLRNVLSLLAGVALTGTAHATTYYWDVNGSTTGSGANATSHAFATSGNWNTDSSGAYGGSSAVPTSTDDAIFAAGTDWTGVATATTVSTSPVSIKGLTLSTNGTGTLITNTGGSSSFTIGSDGIQITGSTLTDPTSTDVLKFQATSGSVTIGAAQSWSNADTTGGVVEVDSSLVISNLLTLSGGDYQFVGASSGAGGVHINLGTSADAVSLSSVGGFGTGTLELTTGALNLRSGASAVTVANTTSIDGNFTFATGAGSNTNVLTMSGPITVSSAPTITLSDTNKSAGGTQFTNTITLDSAVTFNGAGYGTISANIGDDGGTNRSLTYSGSTRLVLSGSNTYTGGTTISSGNIYLTNASGSGTGYGGVLISNGGTLNGKGTIAPTNGTTGDIVHVQAGGTLFPGSGTDSTNKLTITNASATKNLFTADFNSTVAFNFNFTAGNETNNQLLFNGVTATGTGLNTELIFNSGGSGSTNTLVSLTDLSSGLIPTNAAYTLISAPSAADYSGLSFGGTAADGGSIITGGLQLSSNTFTTLYSGSYLELNGGNLEVDVVSAPEPSTWLLLGAGLLVLARVTSLRSRKV